MSWRPTASISNLQLRAQALHLIREFFQHRDILEVETPILAQTSVTEPAIDSFCVAGEYLQTSPEYAMKRLLAAGSGSIFQIAKVFRSGESGRLHHREFTLLEWYRVGFDHQQLMQELSQLLQAMCVDLDVILAPAITLSYREAFEQVLGFDPHTSSLEQLRTAALSCVDISVESDDRDFWLHLLLSHVIEPTLGQSAPTYLVDYPASQAALAKLSLDDQGQLVARRFELYIKGIEIANGYHELLDPLEQRSRFEADNDKRKMLGVAPVPIDERLLAALASGLPDCAGVAMGLERLLMALTGADNIEEFLTFR